MVTLKDCRKCRYHKWVVKGKVYCQENSKIIIEKPIHPNYGLGKLVVNCNKFKLKIKKE